MVKYTEPGATFLRPEGTGHWRNQSSGLKTRQLTRPLAINFIRKSANKPE